MKKISVARYRMILPGLAVFLGLLLCCSPGYAAIEDERPDWWNTADARVVFDYGQFPGLGVHGAGTADGPGGFQYDFHHISFMGNGAFNLFLENYNDPLKVKNIWLAYHVKNGSSVDTLFEISGYVGDDVVEATNVVFRSDNDQEWMFVNAVIVPQPERETFTIVYPYNTGVEIDYLEVATKCVVVPVPSSLLLGGGICALAGIRRKK